MTERERIARIIEQTLWSPGFGPPEETAYRLADAILSARPVDRPYRGTDLVGKVVLFPLKRTRPPRLVAPLPGDEVTPCTNPALPIDPELLMPSEQPQLPYDSHRRALAGPGANRDMGLFAGEVAEIERPSAFVAAVEFVLKSAIIFAIVGTCLLLGAQVAAR